MENNGILWEELSGNVRTKLESIGFEPCGTLKNLDSIPTGTDGKLCLGMECLDRDLWEYKPVLPQLRALGIHRVRLQTGWQKTETTEGVYDFQWLDDAVNDLQANGIDPFLSLSYGNQIYCDDLSRYPNIHNGGVGHIPVETERERTGWQNYVRALVEHFKDRIRYFEIWNEPDVSVFCQCKELSWPEAYMELVKLSAPIIRELAPEATILSCTASDKCLQFLIDLGLGDYVDIHSYHSYNAWPELIGRSQANTVSYAQAKAPHLRFWRGEAGYPSYNDPRSIGALHDQIVSEIRQAKFVLRHILCDLENDLLECTSYFHAYDFEHFMHIVRYHYGIIRHDETHSCKPSYYGLQVLAHLFDKPVKSCSQVSLACLAKNPPELANEKLLAIKTASFELGGERIFSYYLPNQLSDETVAERCWFNLPEGAMKKPVILDPLTRAVYPVADPSEFLAPVTDYPLFLVERETLEKMADLAPEVKAEVQVKVAKQAYEA